MLIIETLISTYWNFRWKSPSMIRRWTALGVVTAEKKFRRIKGYRHMGALVHALRSKQKSLDSDAFAA